MNNFYPVNSVIMAPLAGYTDLPYRRSLRRHGCNFAFTEMIDTGALIYANRHTKKFLERGKDEEYLGVQIVSGRMEEVEQAVKILNNHEFNVLDLNIGCPTPKVAKKGKGAGLAKDIDLVGRIIELMIKESRFPITAKIRIQDTKNPEPTISLAKIIENSGARALTIHGRIAEDVYSGPCFANIISEVKKTLKIQVIANGGVTDIKSYLELKEKSECSEIMVARGAMGNPWIFEELATGQPPVITTEILANEIEQHVMSMVEYYDESSNHAYIMARKVILDYLKGRGFQSELKCKVVKVSNKQEFYSFLEEIKKYPHLKNIPRHP